MHNISHPGIDRPRTLVSTQFYWKDIGSMAKHVRRTFSSRQELGRDAIILKELKPIQVYGVLQRWHEDLFAPLPTTSEGNTEVGNSIITRYGTPQEVVTDNGSEFKGEFAAMHDKV